MQGNYVAVYRLHGLGSLPESEDVELLSMSEPATNVVLTTRPDDYCLHLDRQSAVGTTLLAAIFTNVQGDFETVLTAQLKAAKEARDKHGTGVCLVVNSSGELGQPNFSQRAEKDEFIVCFNAFSKTALRDRLKKLRDTFHTGEIVESNLTVQTAQLLLGKYLRFHVDYHTVESG